MSDSQTGLPSSLNLELGLHSHNSFYPQCQELEKQLDV